MNLSGTYDSTAFHSISSLHDANKHFRDNNGLSFVETKLKSLILQHGVANLFGVALVHRHFDLEEGTVLVEKTWSQLLGAVTVPSRSTVGELSRPFGSVTPPKLEEHAPFVEAFFDAVKLHGLDNFIGLRRLSGHESTGMLECTEGKVNIMFASNEVPAELLRTGTDTMWFFDGQPPYRMYRCACTNVGSILNPNHNHIDQP